MCEEMIKLRQYLDEHEINWLDHSDPPEYTKIHIDRTNFLVGNHFVSVIHGFGTYGGVSLFGNDNKLLEMRIDRNDPKGWLKADDVMKIVEEIQNDYN